MATVASVTRQILIPNLSSYGSAEDNAQSQILSVLNAQPILIGPSFEQSRDNAYTILTITWVAASDTAFLASGILSTIATGLGLSYVPTYSFASTSQY